jgi:uncharacterized membrane protein
VQRDIEKREWLLRRNCSLTPAQTAVAFAVLCLLSLAVGCVFVWLGYWYVLLFSLAETVGAAAAFLHYARHAADYEHVVLTAGCLLVERVSGGEVNQTCFEPCWTRVAVPPRSGALIALESRGRRVEIGCYAMDAQRRAFARELRSALNQNR